MGKMFIVPAFYSNQLKSSLRWFPCIAKRALLDHGLFDIINNFLAAKCLKS